MHSPKISRELSLLAGDQLAIPLYVGQFNVVSLVATYLYTHQNGFYAKTNSFAGVYVA